jgi:phage-related protein
MLSLLEQVSEDVRNPEQWMTTRKCHPITNDKQIWQFTVGSIRVAWFYDKDRVIICTHGFIKDSNNTKKTDQKTAQSTRDKYFHAQKLNNISIEDGE